jgi:lipopolysaccharide export LptBFGC system permease protein LptF
MARLVDPILTDIHYESSAAAAAGHRRTALWIQAAGVIGLFKALAVRAGIELLSIRAWRIEERRTVGRTMLFAVVFATVAVLLLMLPVFRQYAELQRFAMALYLVPQAVPLALPVGILMGLLSGVRGGAVNLRCGAGVMLTAAVFSLASFSTMEWLGPHSNAALRAALAVDPQIPTSSGGMTFGELRARIDAEPDHWNATTSAPMPISMRRFLVAEYHSRWATVAAPCVMAAWALVVAARIPDRRWVVGLVAIATCLGYVVLMLAGRSWVVRYGQPPIAGAWLPNAAILAALILLARRTPNVERRTAA